MTDKHEARANIIWLKALSSKPSDGIEYIASALREVEREALERQ